MRRNHRFLVFQLLVAAACLPRADAVERGKLIRRGDSTEHESHEQDVNKTSVPLPDALTRPAAQEASLLPKQQSLAALPPAQAVPAAKATAALPLSAAGVGIAEQPTTAGAQVVPVSFTGVLPTPAPLIGVSISNAGASPAATATTATAAKVASTPASAARSTAVAAASPASVVKSHKASTQPPAKKKDFKEETFKDKVVKHHGLLTGLSLVTAITAFCCCRMCCGGKKKEINSATARRASLNAAATAFTARRASENHLDPHRSAQLDAQTLNRSYKKSLRGSAAVVGENGSASENKGKQSENSNSDGQRRSSYRERRSKSSERSQSRSVERNEKNAESASPGDRRASGARRPSNGQEVSTGGTGDPPTLRVVPPSDDGPSLSNGSHRSRREAAKTPAETPKEEDLAF